MNALPKYVLRILGVLTDTGYEAYLAGGCVRDLLLSRRPSDWDAASSAPPQRVTELFRHTVPTGLAHGTVTVLSGGGRVEVTAFRSDGDYSDHRRPDAVRFIPDLRGDLARRDFTVNAMAMDAAGEITDPFGGRADLEKKLLRCVGQPETRFREDALRMLRAFRFSARLGFRIEDETLAAIQECAPFCAALSPERVRDELVKTLRSPSPDTVWDMLDVGLLASFAEPPGPAAERPSLRRLPQYARLGRLCAALEELGCIMSTESFLSALRFDNRSIHTAAAAAAILRSGSRDYKRLLRDHGEAAALAAYPADRELRRVIAEGECRSLDALAVNGQDLKALGLRGRELGAMLSRLLDHVIDHPEDNEKEILCKLAESWRKIDG